MASTPNLDIPLVDLTAPASPVVQMNAIATKIDTNVQAKIDALKANVGFYVGTSTQRATALPSVADGSLWQDTNGSKRAYQKDNGAWRAYTVPSVTSASGIFTVASGWKLITFRFGMTLGVCSIYIDVERTGARIDVNYSGDIPNMPLGEIAAGYGTDILTGLGPGGAGRLAGGFTDSTRKVQLAAVNGGGSIDILKGDRISLSGTYLLSRHS